MLQFFICIVVVSLTSILPQAASVMNLVVILAGPVCVPFMCIEVYIVTWQAGRAAFSRRRVSIFFALVLFEFHTYETMQLSMIQDTESSSQLLRFSYSAADSIGLLKKRK